LWATAIRDFRSWPSPFPGNLLQASVYEASLASSTLFVSFRPIPVPCVLKTDKIDGRAGTTAVAFSAVPDRPNL